MDVTNCSLDAGFPILDGDTDIENYETRLIEFAGSSTPTTANDAKILMWRSGATTDTYLSKTETASYLPEDLTLFTDNIPQAASNNQQIVFLLNSHKNFTIDCTGTWRRAK